MYGAALVMLGIGSVAGTVLAIAAKAFHVDVDPRISALEDVLPGANCGGCGYTGCGACAEAIVAGLAPVTACIAGGADTSTDVAKIMGGEVGWVAPKLAQHGCTGGDRATRKYYYEGHADCRTAYELYGGELDCSFGCLGGGTCIEVCNFDALRMGEDGLPEVIPDRCTGCGACERVCPTNVIKIETLADQLLHLQTNHECISPCAQLCPAQIDIPAYVDLASKGDFAGAVDKVRERNPLALICGRVCPAPCEDGCRRAAIEDEPVHHNYIKRFVADWEMSLPDIRRPTCQPDTGKTIAIIGGGPCGLTAAYFLRRLGHHPTIYDAKPEFGGMLRYGIPEYRLPKDVLDVEINMILDLGVEARYNQRLGQNLHFEDLESKHDAILFAMGAWGNSSLRCEGEDLEGVWKGTEFLQKRELGTAVDLTGKTVVVVGGGNTAMDAARSSIRMGAEKVILLYRRTRNEMPANKVEIVAAEHEGVVYELLAAPTRLLGDEDGVLKQIEYIRMELGEPDASGRRRPVPIEGSETVMDIDVVIAAIGQRPLTKWFENIIKERGLELTRWNTVPADDDTLQTVMPHVFTGGDIWSGPALLVDAVGTGRRAARSIHHFLTGQPLDVPRGTYKTPTKSPASHKVVVQGVSLKAQVAQPELDADERIKSFVEVDLVLSEELMKVEAARCMRCGSLCYSSDQAMDDATREKVMSEQIEALLAMSPEK